MSTKIDNSGTQQMCHAIPQERTKYQSFFGEEAGRFVQISSLLWFRADLTTLQKRLWAVLASFCGESRQIPSTITNSILGSSIGINDNKEVSRLLRTLETAGLLKISLLAPFNTRTILMAKLQNDNIPPGGIPVASPFFLQWGVRDYFPLPLEIVKSSSISHSELHLYGNIIDRCYRYGSTSLLVKTTALSKESGKTIRSVERYLLALQELNLISWNSDHSTISLNKVKVADKIPPRGIPVAPISSDNFPPATRQISPEVCDKIPPTYYNQYEDRDENQLTLHVPKLEYPVTTPDWETFKKLVSSYSSDFLLKADLSRSQLQSYFNFYCSSVDALTAIDKIAYQVEVKKTKIRESSSSYLENIIKKQTLDELGRRSIPSCPPGYISYLIRLRSDAEDLKLSPYSTKGTDLAWPDLLSKIIKFPVPVVGGNETPQTKEEILFRKLLSWDKVEIGETIRIRDFGFVPPTTLLHLRQSFSRRGFNLHFERSPILEKEVVNPNFQHRVDISTEKVDREEIIKALVKLSSESQVLRWFGNVEFHLSNSRELIVLTKNYFVVEHIKNDWVSQLSTVAALTFGSENVIILSRESLATQIGINA